MPHGIYLIHINWQGVFNCIFAWEKLLIKLLFFSDLIFNNYLNLIIIKHNILYAKNLIRIWKMYLIVMFYHILIVIMVSILVGHNLITMFILSGELMSVPQSYNTSLKGCNINVISCIIKWENWYRFAWQWNLLWYFKMMFCLKQCFLFAMKLITYVKMWWNISSSKGWSW